MDKHEETREQNHMLEDTELPSLEQMGNSAAEQLADHVAVELLSLQVIQPNSQFLFFAHKVLQHLHGGNKSNSVS